MTQTTSGNQADGKRKDLSYGYDVRGDYALFIERKHLSPDQDLAVDLKAAGVTEEITFFRIIDNGGQTHSHGFIEGRVVVQWG